MDTLFASGRAADIVLAVLAIEAIVLTVRHARSGAGPPPRVFVPMIGAELPKSIRSMNVPNRRPYSISKPLPIRWKFRGLWAEVSIQTLRCFQAIATMSGTHGQPA
mgnify:CR=1 FL=1